ncbi:MAG TPA: arginine--tRNA ligase [Bacillota bacterium]|nr:arginine--tRNA ligase [Bacillota bacterium]
MNILQETEDAIKNEIKQAVVQANLAEEDDVPDVILEKPNNKSHGDFATNIAMQLAKIAKKAPRQIAEEIVNTMNKESVSIEKIDIAGPGFINIFMDHRYLTPLIPAILDAKGDYGKTNTGQGHRIQVEFVSANPTGDLHLGHARGAAVGDSLCNILAKAGYDVEREYYINDAGNQIDNLAQSVETRYMEALGKEANMPEDGYFGQDIIKLGQTIAEEDGEKWMQVPREERLAYFREYSLQFELKKIEQDLARFGVSFDKWFSETSLYESGSIERVLETLQKNGVIYEQDGATWFRTTDFEDDKDRVLIKSDGTYTYLTPDIAYHNHKLERGFETLINIWGADHHGYIPRMQAAIQALGYDKDTLEVQVIQMVNLFENGERVTMSKRTGKAITLQQLMDDVGKDAMRYFFNMRSADSHLDFDMDLARSQSNENPVYYVQYAHARICTMLKQAREQGYDLNASYDASLLTSEKEIELLKTLGEFPQVVADAAVNRTPHRLTQYVFAVASALHRFYNAEKVLNADDLEQTKARIALMQAVQITIVNALQLIGVSAPESM